MKARTLVTVLSLTAIGVCAAMYIQNTRSNRRHKKVDKEALSRWEGEGGPPPPSDDGELTTTTA